MGIAQTAIAWAIPKWRSQRFNWGFPKLNSMLKLRDQGHLLLLFPPRFANSKSLLPNKQDSSFTFLVFIQTEESSWRYTDWNPEREGRPTCFKASADHINLSGYQIYTKMFGCFYNRNGFPGNNTFVVDITSCNYRLHIISLLELEMLIS